MTDKLVEWHLLESRKGVVAVSKHPVYRLALLVENHFDIGKGKGHVIEACVVGAIALGGGGGISLLVIFYERRAPDL